MINASIAGIDKWEAKKFLGIFNRKFGDSSCSSPFISFVGSCRSNIMVLPGLTLQQSSAYFTYQKTVQHALVSKRQMEIGGSRGRFISLGVGGPFFIVPLSRSPVVLKQVEACVSGLEWVRSKILHLVRHHKAWSHETTVHVTCTILDNLR